MNENCEVLRALSTSLMCGFSSIQFFLPTSSDSFHSSENPPCLHFLPSPPRSKDILGLDSAGTPLLSLAPQRARQLWLLAERSRHSPGEAGSLLGQGNGVSWCGWRCGWAAGVSGWQQ